VTEADI